MPTMRKLFYTLLALVASVGSVMADEKPVNRQAEPANEQKATAGNTQLAAWEREVLEQMELLENLELLERMDMVQDLKVLGLAGEDRLHLPVKTIVLTLQLALLLFERLLDLPALQIELTLQVGQR